MGRLMAFYMISMNDVRKGGDLNNSGYLAKKCQAKIPKLTIKNEK